MVNATAKQALLQSRYPTTASTQASSQETFGVGPHSQEKVK